MGPQAWKREAIADLHQILFRPGASIHASKPHAKQRTHTSVKFNKLDSNIYSPIARTFLGEKEPPTTNYFKSPKLYQRPKSSGYHKDQTPLQPLKNQDSKLPKWRKGELLPTPLAEPARKGGLPSKIIKTIWGPTPGRTSMDDEKLEDEANELIHKLRKKKSEADHKPVECLMDVLLRSWIYFEHSHQSVKPIKNHVHAKYCEDNFGHYLLADGTQIHGYYVISLRQLITELKALLAKLKAKVINTTYKKVPMWEPPPQEEVLKFCAPEEKPMPRLYPIEGLLPILEDDIPLDSKMPLLRTPSLKPHPPYIQPKFTRKDAVLNIPPLDNFGKEEKSIEPLKEIPPPNFNPPEPLPLPVWQNPQEEPLPSMPISVEAKVLEPPQPEVIPPYEMPKVEPRPCEASYYPIKEGETSICDGLCGVKRDLSRQSKSSARQYACLARSPLELTIPKPPTYDVIPIPTLQPPKEEPLPPFISPPLIQEPPYVGPPQPNIPEWIPPAPPPPIGYLVGHKPVFLVDCSATMAGDRMTCVQSAIRHLFSTGGQIEIAATHFDIIMYSFDAWSFGALEEERKHTMNGGGPRHWVKSLEMMNTLKELEHQRRLTPIYPVGVEPTKSQARILKNVLANITGGQYMELDMKWQYKLYKEQTENFVSDEMKWLTTRVADQQRRTLEAGMPEKADTILKRLKEQFDMERKDPQIEKYRREEEKAKLQHNYLLDAIREENRRAIEHAQERYSTTHALILEKNRKRFEDARKLWEADVENVRAMNQKNKKLYDEWQMKVLEIQHAKKMTREDARKKFMKDLQSIADRHAHDILYGRDEHNAMVKRIREKIELLVRNHKKKQDEIMEVAKMNNAASWKNHEDTCAQVKALNALNLKNARRDFAIECEKVVKENERRMKEALEDHKWRFEVVTNENGKRRKEHMDKLEELRLKKIEARKSHQLRVSEMVEEHKASVTSVAAINQNLEKEAKCAWEESCKLIDEENKRMTDKCYNEWKEATTVLQMKHEELARRRIDLQLRKEEVERMNSELVRKKKMDWKQTCRQMQEEYLKETERAKLHYEQYVKEMDLHGAQLLEDAKISYEAEVSAIKAYNASIRSVVEESELVEKEIKRVQDFLGYIVSQSTIPGEKKANKKRTLEQSLAMLGNLDSPCPPKVIIEALHIAYAGDLKRHSEMFYEETIKKKMVGDANLDESISIGKKRQQGRFSDMKQIQPSRVLAHHCEDFKPKRDKIPHYGKAKKGAPVTFEGQQEIAKGNVAPMVEEAKAGRGS